MFPMQWRLQYNCLHSPRNVCISGKLATRAQSQTALLSSLVRKIWNSCCCFTKNEFCCSRVPIWSTEKTGWVLMSQDDAPFRAHARKRHSIKFRPIEVYFAEIALWKCFTFRNAFLYLSNATFWRALYQDSAPEILDKLFCHITANVVILAKVPFLNAVCAVIILSTNKVHLKLSTVMQLVCTTVEGGVVWNDGYSTALKMLRPFHAA